MYQEYELKELCERLKRQYPNYQIEWNNGCLTVTRIHGKVEVTFEGATLYVNEQLYDQFTSAEVRNLDDLYELIELFLLDLQHAGMEQGNETYVTALKQGSKSGTRFLIGSSVCLMIVIFSFIWVKNLWLMLPIFLLPSISLIILKQIRKTIFQKYWVCPTCGQQLPLKGTWVSSEPEYVSKCPHCGRVLEQAPDFEKIEKEECSVSTKTLEPPKDLPKPGSKWFCLLSGGITTAFALVLLPAIFVPDGEEALDMLGVGVGVGILLFLLCFGILLLFCRHTEPDEKKQPVVIVRERMLITILGLMLWVIGLVLTLVGVILAGTPPFEAGNTAFVSIPGILLFLLGAWMLLAGRNRTLFVFQDNSILYISSFGRKREFLPGQVASVQLTVNRSIHLLDKQGKKLTSIETNMQGVPRFVEWVESLDLDATLTPTMEQQVTQEEQQEATIQWREEYRTKWHDHIKSIRMGLWAVILIYAIGTLLPIPLFLFVRVKFRIVMILAAFAPIPFLVFCMVFSNVLLFGDRPKKATAEWNAMHIKVPIILVMLVSLIYMGQVHYVWDAFILQEEDTSFWWLIRILVVGTILTVLLIIRMPKRMRLEGGIFMGMISFCLAIGLHYYVNVTLTGPIRHYPAVIVDSHAEDPNVKDDDYTLTVLMDNGKEAEIVVMDQIYEMAMNGEALDVCQRKSLFGVNFLSVHKPKEQ